MHQDPPPPPKKKIYGLELWVIFGTRFYLQLNNDPHVAQAAKQKGIIYKKRKNIIMYTYTLVPGFVDSFCLFLK